MERRQGSKRSSKVLPKPKRRLLTYEKRLRSRGYSSIAGVDEAGRGPLAGPVVASAVILKSYAFKARIDDSKRLTEKARERAYDEIADKAFVGLGIVDETRIDRVNIYYATRLAMERAIANLNVPPDYVLIDGRMKVLTPCPQECIVRGDSKSMSIAAASIIAKVTRDRLMRFYDVLYPIYGFKEHKGYPTKRHKEALIRHGPSPLHRFSYAPVKASNASWASEATEAIAR